MNTTGHWTFPPRTTARQRCSERLRALARLLRRAPGAAAVALCLLAGAPAAQAQTEVTLVTSLQANATFISAQTHDTTDGRVDLSQQFSTGTHAHGYKLNSVTLWVRRSGTIDESTLRVTIRTSTGDVTLTRPDTVVATLTKSTGAIGTTYAKHTWEAPTGTLLRPGSTYYLFIEHTEAADGTEVFFSTAETPTGTYGWTTLRRSRSYPQSASPGTETPLGMEVKGVVVTPPDAVDDLVSTPGCDGLELSWSAVTGATRYRVEWKRPNGYWPAEPPAGVRRIVSGTSMTLDALQARGEHKLRVRAGNEYGFSGGSNVLTVTDVGCVTAEWADAPEMHMGEGNPFTVTLNSSVPVVGTKRDMRRRIVSVTGAEIVIAKRTDKAIVWSELGGNGRMVTAARAWELTVAPSGSDDITLEVEGDLECNAEGALCGHRGEKLSKTVSITIPSQANLRDPDPDSYCPKGGTGPSPSACLMRPSPKGGSSSSRSCSTGRSRGAQHRSFRSSSGGSRYGSTSRCWTEPRRGASPARTRAATIAGSARRRCTSAKESQSASSGCRPTTIRLQS